MRLRVVFRAAFCWVLFAITPPTLPIAIDEEMLKTEDPLYEQCLQMFLDFSTALANDLYLTECHNRSDNITSHCFSEYSSICGSGQLPEITMNCEAQMDSPKGSTETGDGRGERNAKLRPLHPKKIKCVAQVLVVMMANNNVGLCTALQLCSNGHVPPRCNEHYSLFKESLQQFCLYPGWPLPTLGSLERRADLVEKCRRDMEKCSLTVKIISACFAVAATAIIVILFTFVKKCVGTLRHRRGRYTLADYVPPINTATSATRLDPGHCTTDFDDVCSYLSHGGVSKWSELTSTSRSRQYEKLKEEKQDQPTSLTTTFESSFSDGEICSSCCNYGSTNPGSMDSDSKPSAVSESELLVRRPRRSAEFPRCPVGRGVGSSLGRGYYSESGAARFTVCERARAWRNMVAHRQLMYPPNLSRSLPSKISQRDPSPFKSTKTTSTDKTHPSPHHSLHVSSVLSEPADKFDGGAKWADGTCNKSADPWVKRNTEEQKGLEDRRVGEPDQNRAAKTERVIGKTEIEERGWGFKQPDVDQIQKAEKPGPSRILETEMELRDVGHMLSVKNHKHSTSTEEIESIVTTV